MTIFKINFFVTSHETVKTIENKISKDIFNNYFKFAIVKIHIVNLSQDIII